MFTLDQYLRCIWEDETVLNDSVSNPWVGTWSETEGCVRPRTEGQKKDPCRDLLITNV